MFTDQIYMVSLIVLLSSTAMLALAADAKTGRWWAVGKEDPEQATAESASRRLLTSKQRKMLRQDPGSYSSVIIGARQGLSECQHQFSYRRWNCSTTQEDNAKSKTLFGKVLDREYRETSFVYAIMSAGVTHAVTRGCSDGSIETCTCDFQDKGASGPDWEWGGCSANVEFGLRYSRKFIDSAERTRDLRSIVNLHNTEAGRSVVESEMKRDCKCHGMSGSCAVKTCWLRLPDFRVVGDILKERFDGASRVTIGNTAGRSGGGNRGRGRGRARTTQSLQPYDTSHKLATKTDLVYVDESPDFCAADTTIGSPGTFGRECNDTSVGVDGCALMCCGRGYTSATVTVRERCMCTFEWCCEVKCKECVSDKVVHTCL